MNDSQTVNPLTRISTREQVKALGIASLGSMLEYFEFIIFVFLAPQIAKHFSSPDMPEWLRLMQTFGIFAAGFLIRPVGGILMAQLGDLVGRKRIFTLTLALMAGPTLAIGMLPGYESIGIWAPILLLVCRLLQGISLGGELPGAISFVSEQVNGRRVAFALGALAAATGGGSLIGSMTVSALTNIMGAQAVAEYGWRIPFLMGGFFGILSVYLRKFTHETPVFEAMKERLMLSERPPFAVLISQHRFNLFAGMLLAACTTIVAAATQQFPISYFVTMKKLPMAEISTYVTIMIACSSVGNLMGGFLASWRVFTVPTGYVLMQALTMFNLFWVFSFDATEGLLLPMACLGITAGASMALSLTLLARAFPAHIRYTGLATCYNIPIAIFGGTALIVLTYLSSLSLTYPPFYPAVFMVIASTAAVLLWRRRNAINPFDEDDPDSNPLTKEANSTAVFQSV